MNTPTLARDAAGNVMLTAEQAVEMARWALGSTGPIVEASPAGASDIHAAGETVTHAVLRWVERWAPVIAAAAAFVEAKGNYDALGDQEGNFTDAEERELRDAKDVAARALEAAVRAARAARGGAS